MNTSKSKSAYYAGKVNNYATRASKPLKISDGLSTNIPIFSPKTTEYTKIYKWEPYNQFNLKTNDDDEDDNFQNNCT